MSSLEKNAKTIFSKPNIKEAGLYERLSDDKVKCILCERRCIVRDGEKGFCKTRLNINGKLYTLVYGDLSAVESRPIEIKPFFHYWVGSTALTFSTWSCNFTCPWCQNHHLSKVDPNPLNSIYYSPEEIVNLALKLGDEGLCASFQEPTLLTEWCLDTFKLGSIKGLYCCYVSNGYMTTETLKLLRLSGMDGLKVDVKGGKEEYKKYCGGVDVDVVWRNTIEAKRMGIHVEIVNLIVTGVNDDDECIRETIETHVKKLGVDVPIHFTRYYPAYKFNNSPTKIEVLEKAYKMAKNLGVYYPYLGNVPGHPWENTYCPSCGELLIGRIGYKIVKYNINPENRCQRCGFKINLTGKFVKKPYKPPF
ncbi:MAG: AmmeMemoRadiSam system radical SAM enzyme [Candidatus Bathyarchaeota archaeon]